MDDGRRPSARSLPAAAAAVVLVAATVGAAPQDFPSLEQLLTIPHPSPPVWSPGGDRIAFLWELDGAVDLWWTSEESEEAQPVTRERGRRTPAAVAGFCWSADGGGLIYSLRGDLHLYRFDTDTSRRLTETDGIDTSPVLAPDGSRLAFIRDGDLWTAPFSSMEGAVLADLDGISSAPRWSPDGSYLAILYGTRERIAEEARSLVGDKLEFLRRPSTAADLAIVDAATGAVHWVEQGDAYAGDASFSSSGKLAWQEISASAKRRRIRVASPPDWGAATIVEDDDEAWWTLTYLRAGPQWEPQGDRFVFISERDGYAHLYLASAAADEEPVQLTAGLFEVEAPAWDPSGGRLVLSANRGSAAERGLFLLEIAAGQPGDLVPISMLRGTSTDARWRPDGAMLAYLHADNENPLDVWAQGPSPERARQLTESWPEGADEEAQLVPQAIRFSSADRQLVPGQLFLPPDYDELEGPLPAVVWVHGGGVRQNRYGWHPLRAYAMFYGLNQYLAQQGYVVLTVDYRGSIGYGRDFRAGHYRDLGGLDLDDVLAGARYLRGLEVVEVGKVGVWGISYGGYLTLQALTRAPTAFDAGVNIAGVADWADWAVDPGGLWIEGRMGSVEENVELYRDSSPIHFVEQLSRPLLTLHGTADKPVPVLQSFRLIDALVRAGKPHEVMIYPGEEHVFVRTATWRDAFRRVEEFFDRTLR